MYALLEVASKVKVPDGPQHQQGQAHYPEDGYVPAILLTKHISVFCKMRLASALYTHKVSRMKEYCNGNKYQR